jgi:hypothetical protein
MSQEAFILFVARKNHVAQPPPAVSLLRVSGAKVKERHLQGRVKESLERHALALVPYLPKHQTTRLS